MLTDIRFHDLLLACDRDLADERQRQCCADCGARLDVANFNRKPRGRPLKLGPEHNRRRQFLLPPGRLPGQSDAAVAALPWPSRLRRRHCRADRNPAIGRQRIPPRATVGRRPGAAAHDRAPATMVARHLHWDLGHVHLVDERTGTVLARLYPQDKTQNASGLRRSLDPVSTASIKSEPASSVPDPTIPPLLARMLDRQAATSLAPPYLPMRDTPDSEEGETS